jgi:NAD(P)-dependent dehydrogenase (short-subunit alcohol dehydrogenase family)
MRLEGKIGLITAAASGMGRAGAERFAREGATVAVVDINAEAANAVAETIRAAGGKALAITGDLRDDAFSRDIVRQTVDAFGGLDFAWLHAGHPAPAAVEGIDMAEYDLSMDLNLRTALLTTEAAIPALRARGQGALLYTSSTSGVIGSYASPVYSIAKFGIIGFVRSLAKRLAPEGIRVNAICPGPVDTPMLRNFVLRSDQQAPPGQDRESLIVQRNARIPFGRAARPDEVANVALFLLSDEASYVSGIALPIDGAATA